MSCVSVELVLPLALLVLLQCFLISHTSFIICVCIRSIPHPLHTTFNISVPAFCITLQCRMGWPCPVGSMFQDVGHFIPYEFVICVGMCGVPFESVHLAVATLL